MDWGWSWWIPVTFFTAGALGVFIGAFGAMAGKNSSTLRTPPNGVREVPRKWNPRDVDNMP